MNNELLILLDSGFSVPKGLPSVTQLNHKLANLKADDFYLTSEQKAGFYKTNWTDPNAWMPNSRLDRDFAEKFIELYNTTVLKEKDQFHYETFFDFFSEFMRFKKHSKIIHPFCEQFRNTIQSEAYKNDDYNYVFRFGRIFNQLISDLLTEPSFYDDVSYGNYPPYDGFFVSLANHITNTGNANIFSLNHNIFFDKIAAHYQGLWQYYCDGFTHLGSKYYGQIRVKYNVDDHTSIGKSYYVRLKQYTGTFTNKLRFYKLHGSIDNYLLYPHAENKDRVRIKSDYAVHSFFYEHQSAFGQYELQGVMADQFPEFLTGTTEKIRLYREPFYSELLDTFKTSLLNAMPLVVIGYGFQDKVINEYLENFYLIYNKPLTVVDIRNPNPEFLDKYADQVMLLDKGATGTSFYEYLDAYKQNGLSNS